MPDALQALEAAEEALEDTAVDSFEAAATTSSREATASTDSNNAAPKIEDASIDDLLQALDSTSSIAFSAPKPDAKTAPPAGGKPAPAAAAPTTPEPTEEEEEPEEEEAEQIAVAGQPGATVETTPPKTARNFRLHTEDPKLASFLSMLKSAQRSNPGVNPADVAAVAGYGSPAAQATAVAAAPAAQVERAADPRIDSLRTEITALEEQITEHRAKYENAEADTLLRSLMKKERELEKVEEADQAQAAADAEYDAGYAASRARCVALSPEAGQKGTVQFALVLAAVKSAEAENDPMLDHPDYPERILRQVAAQNPTFFPKVAKAAPAGTPALKAPVARTAPKGQPTSRPVGVVVAGNGQSTPIDASNAEDHLGELSTEQLMRALDQSNDLKQKRGKK